MEKLLVEVMNMKNRDTTFLQKLKDNAFYVALGLGLLAVLAVVAVYTVEQNGNQIAQNEVDLNKASDYSQIATEGAKTTETNAKTVQREQKTTEHATTEMVKSTTEQMSSTQKVSESVTNTGSEQSTLPVTTDIGELNFSSDKTITWPVKGEVILPFSMETTVYFKTLDQYQCNPGMLIAVGSGSTVKNAYLGKVTKVTSDDVYGNLVTVYIGNDYSLVYGQLDTIYVKEGDYVKAGESIGTIGKPTDSFLEEGSHLFFEMLQKDTPVDPVLFIE